MRVIGEMTTSDGAWRVQAVRQGTERWYRVVHGENVVDHLVIAQVREILTGAGVDMAELEERAA